MDIAHGYSLLAWGCFFLLEVQIYTPAAYQCHAENHLFTVNIVMLCVCVIDSRQTNGNEPCRHAVQDRLYQSFQYKSSCVDADLPSNGRQVHLVSVEYCSGQRCFIFVTAGN